jgi:uncharacterized protein (TIGR02996 family)
MNDEAGFLRAIQARPEDDATRLVYADWLEERGDIRGEYLRLEHQLAQAPLRLAQLRAQIDHAWLAAVSKRRKVVLVSFPRERKLHVIKLVREITGLGLKEVVDLVAAGRSTIQKDLTIEEAEQLAKRFQGLAVVSVEPDPGT